jgi:hypothetical protein
VLYTTTFYQAPFYQCLGALPWMDRLAVGYNALRSVKHNGCHILRWTSQVIQVLDDVVLAIAWLQALTTYSNG